MAASGRERTDPVDSLRAKYVELALKYRHLVDRLDRRTTHDLAVYQLGAWGLEATNAALAVVEAGEIKVANARFAALARKVGGPLVATDPETGESWRDLRSLALVLSGDLAAQRATSRDLRVREQVGGMLLSVRLELAFKGKASPVMILAENVTERVRRDEELKRTREALLRRERLRVLGELALSIAHDLGNTLRGASFQLTMLENAQLPLEKRLEAVRAIGPRIETASAVIARLHDFARSGSLEVASVRLDRIASEAVALVGTELREGAPVAVRMSMHDLPQVRGVPAELSLMFVNLLRNARDAMPEGGIVTVTGRRTRAGVVVAIADQGHGLSPTTQKRLFEPFFSTKGPLGTGLGLWLAAGTMDRLGGGIKAANRPRGGAIFTLMFPAEHVSRGAAPRSPREESSRAAAHRGPPSPAPRRTRRARRNAART